MNKDIEKRITIMMRDTILIYVVAVLIVLIVKTVFAFIYEEPIIENIMLNVRSYVFGIVDVDEKFLVTKFESIGFFAVHFILFFSMFFCIVLYGKTSSYENENVVSIERQQIVQIVKIVVCFLIGLVLFFFVSKRVPFCLTLGFALSGIIYLICKYCCKILNVKFFRIVLILYTIICLIFELFPYFES